MPDPRSDLCGPGSASTCDFDIHDIRHSFAGTDRFSRTRALDGKSPGAPSTRRTGGAGPIPAVDGVVAGGARGPGAVAPDPLDRARRLLGHRRVETTARYAHLARDSIRESAERIAVSIAVDQAGWHLTPKLAIRYPLGASIPVTRATFMLEDIC